MNPWVQFMIQQQFQRQNMNRNVIEMVEISPNYFVKKENLQTTTAETTAICTTEVQPVSA